MAIQSAERNFKQIIENKVLIEILCTDKPNADLYTF